MILVFLFGLLMSKHVVDEIQKEEDGLIIHASYRRIS